MFIFESVLARTIVAIYLVIIAVVLGRLYFAPGETIGGISVLLTFPSYLLSDWLGIHGTSRPGELAILAACATLNALILFFLVVLLERTVINVTRAGRRP